MRRHYAEWIQENKEADLRNMAILKSKNEEMTREISRLKKGIEESIDELDQILGEEDARS